ncbi:aminopeptidase, partial [bacterium]|nr:aminopeptidase [bacterium]
MKRAFRFTPFIFLFLLFLAPLGSAADNPDYDSVANNLVNKSLNVQPGESVLITGTPAEIKLLEAIYVAVFKAGGQPVVQLNMPQA